MGMLIVDDDALGEADGDLGLMGLRCAGVGRLGWQRCIAWTLEDIGIGSKRDSFQRQSTTI